MLKPFDICIAIPALGAVIASFFFAYAGAGGHSTVNLKGDSGEWVFSANAVETISLSGPLGDTVIAIYGGAARITSSPCMNQTCVSTGAIRSPGQWAACLPNRVMAYIGEAKTANDIDTTAW